VGTPRLHTLPGLLLRKPGLRRRSSRHAPSPRGGHSSDAA
jgi:hypothetical protein